MFGQNQMNTATNFDFALSTATVGKLAPKWKFKTGGDVSARAAVVNGVAYFQTGRRRQRVRIYGQSPLTAGN